jgi:hypothetical protein
MIEDFNTAKCETDYHDFSLENNDPAETGIWSSEIDIVN